MIGTQAKASTQMQEGKEPTMSPTITVEEAQAAIVRVIRTVEESGQIDMSRGGDELVVWIRPRDGESHQ